MKTTPSNLTLNIKNDIRSKEKAVDGEVTIGEATVAADVSSVGHMSSLHTALYQRPLHCHDTEHISQFCICVIIKHSAVPLHSNMSPLHWLQDKSTHWGCQRGKSCKD